MGLLSLIYNVEVQNGFIPSAEVMKPFDTFSVSVRLHNIVWKFQKSKQQGTI